KYIIILGNIICSHQMGRVCGLTINDVRNELSSHTTQVPALSIIEILSNMTLHMCHNALQ
ncbi:hypothetical protein ACFOZZ_08125, partial [Catenibacterium sp. GCM10023432]|uniref:hypothetical protein n=1 Tax=Catenibacterium sp. GCM10023432 TaxID=3252638 RepID=UPI00360B78FF